jgi:hypothetical protein
MGIHARIEPGGYIAIDTTAWLDVRTAGRLDDLTSDLRRWVAARADDGSPLQPGQPVGVHRAWPSLTAAWCRQHAYERPEPALIDHADTRLDGDIWIVRAQTDGHGPIAVVGIDHDPPTVHADGCTDPWDWFDADSVTITCPAGHGWTWRTGRELVSARGTFTTLTLVFGPDLDAPFTYPTDTTPTGDTPERGGLATPQILCPTCGTPCEVDLPTI